jgi:SAM-dependent methyltransferase
MKRLIKLAIGSLAYVYWRLFRPQRLRAVRDQYFASHSLSFLERQVLALDLQMTHTDTQTASRHWAGSAGSLFHSHADHRLTLDVVAKDTFYRRPMLEQFAIHATCRLGPGASVVEVGCGAGGNLLYLREQLTDRQFRFFGFDVNSDVISNACLSKLNDVTFEVKDCYASEIAVPADLGLIFCAVLMYAREQDIEGMLRGVIRNCRSRILLGLSEPVLDPDAVRDIPHNNLALLHGYRRILRQLNFQPLFESFRQEDGKDTRIYHAVFELQR